MSQRGRSRMAYNQSRRMRHYQRNLNFVVPRGRGARHEPPPRMPVFTEGDWCENSDNRFSPPEIENHFMDQQQNEHTHNFGPKGRRPLCGPRPRHHEPFPMDTEWCEASDVLENQSMKQQQRNSKLFPRGRQPCYNLNPNYGRSPSMQNSKEDNWCETCDRGFPTPQMLEDHKQQHQKCNIDGCQFVAHPKIITKHIQMQHSTGLFKKIANLNNPEDIKKWREDRKNNYPTKINVEKKKAEIKAKIDRGEKMGLKRNKNIKNGENQKRKHPQAQENDHSKIRNTANPVNSDPNNIISNKKRKKKNNKEEMLPPPENIRKLKPFPGILDLVMEKTEIENEGSVDNDDNLHYQIEDDDDYLPKKQEVASSATSDKQNICGALSSLMCEYGSSDEEIEKQIPNNKPLIANAEDIPNNKNKDQNECTTPQSNKDCDHENICEKVPKLESSNPVTNQKLESDEDNPPEEVKIEREKCTKNEAGDKKFYNSNTKKTKNENNSHNKINNRNKKPYKKLNIPSTLLQKLLRREIQQERNIILQCIRHIVKNNYFDK